MEVNITYKREMKHNYLIIEPLDDFKLGYECKMLLCNSIDGLLKFHLKQLDGSLQYYYEITSRQPLSRLLEKQCITSEEISLLLVHISQTLNQMESYLLKEEQILLDPDYIYIEQDSFFVSLCLIPGRMCNFPDDLGKLLQYILSKVNHQDKDSVVLAYSLFQESQKENYGIDDLLKLLTGERQACKEPESEADNSFEFTKNLDPYHSQKNPENEEKENNNRKWPERNRKYHENIKKSVNNKNTINKNNGKDLAKKDAKNNRDINNIQNTMNTKSMNDSRNKRGNSHVGDGLNESKINGRGFHSLSKKPGSQQDNKPGINRKSNGEMSILFLFLMAALPLGVWFVYGIQGLHMFLVWIIGIEVILAIMLLAALAGFFSYRKTIKKETDETSYSKIPQNSWQMVFEDDLDEEYGTAIQSNPNKNMYSDENMESGGCNTVLLTDLENYQNTHRLISLDECGQEILLPYFPFIIGKQEGIADYVLAEETVSRLHARIDEEDGVFRITDLNSTNGTKVGGRLLENNESALMAPGQEIYLADHGFRFI